MPFPAPKDYVTPARRARRRLWKDGTVVTKTWKTMTTGLAAAGVVVAAAISGPGAAAAPLPGGSSSSAVKLGISLQLPTAVSYGDTALGAVSVSQAVGTSVYAVAGLPVQLQQLRGGSYVTVTSGVTDGRGVAAFSFTSRRTATWRAVVKQGSKQLTSRPRTVVATSVVTWAGRPDTDVRHGVKTEYKITLTPGQGAVGQFQIATAAKPKSWRTARLGSAGFGGVFSGTVVFPAAGTWLLRGVSKPTATAASGTTSVLKVTVR
jgi:hypothetical protein